MNSADRVYRSLNAAADMDGNVDCSVNLLCSWTGLSRASIFRALEQLTRDGAIETTGKRGPAGGLTIGLTKGLTKVSPKVSQTSQNRSAGNASTQAPGPSALGGLLRETNSELVSPEVAEEPGPIWFVCCIWYDDKGACWCHGDDGYPTYIPCASKEAAMDLAIEHRNMPHRGLPSHPAVFPSVDVCEQLGRGKVLFHRFDDITPDLTGRVVNPERSRDHLRRILRGEQL